MKHLILAALLVAPLAQAGTIWRSGNEQGGTINLTAEKRGCPNDWRYAYSTNGGGQVILTGCWMYYDGAMEVNWGGTIMRYAGGFQVLPKGLNSDGR